MLANDVVCKYCHSPNVIKFGILNGVQRYFCKSCRRKFVNNQAIPKMHSPTSNVADCLNMYYEGMSLAEIRRNLIQQDRNYISRISAFNWVNRFTDLAVKEAAKYHPQVGDTWIADETFVRVDKRIKGDTRIDNPYSKNKRAKWMVFWDIIDADTRFLLASHATTTRTTKDAQILMEKAAARAGKVPRVVVTDSLRAYLDGAELAYGRDTEHRQGGPFGVENNTNLIERFHGTLKERTKVMRGLHDVDSASRFLNGWLVHYNYFRPHMALHDQTPAEAAGLRFPFRDWKDVVEQPFEVTARIPMQLPARPIPRAKPIRAKRHTARRESRRESTPVAILRVRG